MPTLNYFFQHQLTPALSVRTGNMVAQFSVPDFLLGRGFENITEGEIEETLLSVEANKIFDLKLQKTAKPRYDFT